MKSKLLIYFLPMLFTAFLLLGYGIMDVNPDYNVNAPVIQDPPQFPVDNFTTATWTTLTASPHAVSRSGCVYIKRNDTGYVYQFGGGSAAQLRNVARYNLVTNTWANSVSTMPQDISAGAAITYGDSVIFVFGGYSATVGTITGHTLKYNIVTNTWTQMAAMPSGVTDALVVKYRDTLAYVIGGGDGLFQPPPTLARNTVQIYNFKSNTYTSGGTLPAAVAMMGGGIYRDTIIVTAGWNGSAGVATSYKGVINPATLQITWTTIANYPPGAVTRMASYTCLIPGQGVGIACSGGAVGGSTLTAAGSFWNFCTQSWQALPNNSLARSNLRGTGAGDNIMYIVGGFTTVGVGTFERLTFSQIDGTCASPPPPPGCVIAGQWAPSGTFPAVPGGSYLGASAWLGDTLYVQNTTATGTAGSQIVRYTWNGTWSTGVPLPGPKVGMALVAAAGRLYAISGASNSITAGPFTNEMLSYNPLTGAWTTLATLPAALTGHSAVVWGDSVIFVVGGPWASANTNLNVHYYRIASNTWGTITNSLPAGQGRRSFGLGIIGNKIIMSGGFHTVFLKNTYVGTIGSDASSITWASAPDIPVPAFFTGLSRPGATTYGDFFFLVNGERGPSGGYHDTTHVFSATLNQWVGKITNIPFKRSNIFNNVTARCINDTVSIFVPAGYGSVTGATPGAATTLFDVTRVGLLTGVTPVNTGIPGVYELSQNYPNPFNPATTINFSMPKTGFVTLKIYDILGKEVATLVNEIRNAGNHSIDFNASALSSGTYFYRIESGNFTSVKKMMLLK